MALPRRKSFLQTKLDSKALYFREQADMWLEVVHLTNATDYKEKDDQCCLYYGLIISRCNLIDLQSC